jgi:hypothetical protein
MSRLNTSRPIRPNPFIPIFTAMKDPPLGHYEMTERRVVMKKSAEMKKNRVKCTKKGSECQGMEA